METFTAHHPARVFITFTVVVLVARDLVVKAWAERHFTAGDPCTCP
jgi:hypothetical protein